MKIDEKDKKIIKLLKENSRLTINQISKKINLPITTIHNRIKKLTKEKIIKNFTINLNYRKIGKPIKAHILISINQKNSSQEEIAKKIKQIPDVETADITTGTTDILATIRTKDIPSLNQIITRELRNISGVDKTQTLLVLDEI